jgi:hypothetical protein
MRFDICWTANMHSLANNGKVRLFNPISRNDFHAIKAEMAIVQWLAAQIGRQPRRYFPSLKLNTLPPA